MSFHKVSVLIVFLILLLALVVPVSAWIFNDDCSGAVTDHWTVESGTATNTTDTPGGFPIYNLSGMISYKDNTSIGKSVVTFTTNKSKTQRVLVKFEYLNSNNFIMVDLNSATAVISEFIANVQSTTVSTSSLNWSGYKTWRIEHERNGVVGVYLDGILVVANSNLTTARSGSLLIQSTSPVAISNITVQGDVIDKDVLPGTMIYLPQWTYPHLTKTNNTDNKHWFIVGNDSLAKGYKQLVYVPLATSGWADVANVPAANVLVNISGEDLGETSSTEVGTDLWLAFYSNKSKIYFVKVDESSPSDVTGDVITLASNIGETDAPYAPKIVSFNSTYHVMYQRPYNATPGIYERTSSDGITWSTESLITSEVVNDPDPVVINGVLHLFTGNGFGTETPGSIYVLKSTNGITWSSPELIISDPSDTDTDPDVVVAPDNTAHLVYGFGEAAPFQYLKYSYMYDNGTWKTPVILTPDITSQKIGGVPQIYRTRHNDMGDDPELFYDSDRGGLGIYATTFLDYYYPSENIDTTSPPVASFTTNVTSGTVPLAVGFTDTSTNTPTDWDWYINGVKFSDLQNPEYTFTDAGVYDVSLYAANGASGDWENKTGYITTTNWYDLQCENQTGNISINLFSNSTTSLGWNWDDPVNITKIAEDGLYVLSFDNSSDYFIGTGYSPESWHKLRIYNETDYGQLNCTTDAVPVTPTPIPIMPSTESNVNPANLFQYWPYAVLVLGLVVVFKKW